jgi:hypothetical protein
MKLIPHPVYSSTVLLGFRVVPSEPPQDVPPLPGTTKPDPASIEQVLVAIAKGTFAADDPPATPLTPAEPILQTDVPFNPPFNQHLRLEHDVAPFKPRADIVVLGAPAPPAPPPEGGTLVGGRWTERVAVGANAMEQDFTDSPATRARPFTFGWEDRTTKDRRGPQSSLNTPAGHAGFYGSPPSFDPEDRLPVGFNDTFANGGRYDDATMRPPFPHLPPGAVVEVTATADYETPGGAVVTRTTTRRLHLPAEAPVANLTLLDDCDVPRAQLVTMRADTVVLDKVTTRFTVVWRGGRPADRDALGRLVALRIQGGV